MILISELLLGAILTGIVCTIWGTASTLSGIFTWVGFAGCTSYFVVGEKDPLKNAFKSYISNLSGIFWATTSIYISNLIGIPALGIIITTGLVTVCVIYQSKFEILSSVPACFIGCFITFALNGDYKMAAIGLLCGAILGYFCDQASKLAAKIKNKNINNKVEMKKA
ncbi:Protein of unknown function [Alkalithermobacter thermoalcaliphilus JW-YL-7 = DSM 7308]|uniref:DUF1097 domain-containing protein n=1 Tax=Alkalithermobacter thermoalcaliphilus JW-YL-7 = DSM 7308 TaxID=1121328 RepID=A0A150FNF6_CLOPD|nr:protein of unknown function DUF1097 [[Clostridium] paradoxum JW-YL-7 = DSM 7308]SHK92091.1 Protein of unknown function [[Clostridium] paradoxum JW-YL-7 = DSM 7308]